MDEALPRPYLTDGYGIHNYKIPRGKTQGFNLGMIARNRLTLR